MWNVKKFINYLIKKGDLLRFHYDGMPTSNQCWANVILPTLDQCWANVEYSKIARRDIRYVQKNQ